MEEYIDILNENGELTGEIRTKREVHELGLWHRAVHIWILNPKGELLLQQRAEQKENYGGYWDISAAGHVSAGETSIESALREIEEELGVKIRERELISFGTVIQQKVINNETYINNEYNDLFIIEKDIPLPEMTMQKSEVQDLKYILWRELKEMVESNDEQLVPHPEEYELLFQYLEKKFS